ncbi:MAG: hypothetical protein IKN48_00900 [Bacteroidaceae bacterium]|nr:hypothetical protein [Bacteroidaceae bacterium]
MKIDDKIAALMIEGLNDFLDKVAAHVIAAGFTSEDLISLMTNLGAMHIACVARMGVKPDERDKFLKMVMAEIKEMIRSGHILQMPDMN